MHWKTALILGASLVVAVIAHGLLSNPTDRGKIRYVVELESPALRQLSDSQLSLRKVETEPRSLQVGGENLVYVPYGNLNFYRYHAESQMLIKVPVDSEN
jgi:hypothetical protein